MHQAYNKILAATSLISRDILSRSRQKFTRSYDDEIPTSLEQLLKWMIIGPKDTVDLKAKKKKNVNVTIKNIKETDYINKIKKTQVNNASGKFRHAETPFSVGLVALYSSADSTQKSY